MEELLKNNSQLYPDTPGLSEYLIEILSRSSFLELKIYRDRVKEYVIGKSREAYANDKDWVYLLNRKKHAWRHYIKSN